MTEAENLRSMARACHNVQKQRGGDRAWFDWVPKELERLPDEADRRSQPTVSAHAGSQLAQLLEIAAAGIELVQAAESDAPDVMDLLESRVEQFLETVDG